MLLNCVRDLGMVNQSLNFCPLGRNFRLARIADPVLYPQSCAVPGDQASRLGLVGISRLILVFRDFKPMSGSLLPVPTARVCGQVFGVGHSS